MGQVFKKAYTKPMPAGAEFLTRKGERIARWRDAKGKARTASVTVGKDGTDRLALESRTYFARYRDGNGIVVECSTECHDEGAARAVLSDLERRAERVRAGLITPTEDRVSGQMTRPIAEQVAAYLTSLEATGVTAKHLKETRRCLNRLIGECEFRAVADFDRSTVERWLVRRRDEGASARTRNVDLTAILALTNWCVANRRLLTNPFLGITKANEAADPRRRRRAMTEVRLVKLLSTWPVVAPCSTH